MKKKTEFFVLRESMKFKSIMKSLHGMSVALFLKRILKIHIKKRSEVLYKNNNNLCS